MTLKGGTNQACAACKYQRRKCMPDCPLAPYFPPDQPKTFQNAHRLFGVKKISKILKQLNPSQKMMAMRSIIVQSDIREKYPVYGSLEVICQLQYQIRYAQDELQAILAQLAFYQQQEMSSSEVNDSMSQLQLGMGLPNNDLTLFHQETAQNYNAAFPIPSHYSYSNTGNAGYNSEPHIQSKDDNVTNSFWSQQPYDDSNNNNVNDNDNSIAMQSHMITSQPATIQEDASQDYDEIHPFFDTIDDRQSYIDSKVAYQSSSESSLKDTTQSMEQVAENELKNAAACFSLTSVN